MNQTNMEAPLDRNDPSMEMERELLFIRKVEEDNNCTSLSTNLPLDFALETPKPKPMKASNTPLGGCHKGRKENDTIMTNYIVPAPVKISALKNSTQYETAVGSTPFLATRQPRLDPISFIPRIPTLEIENENVNNSFLLVPRRRHGDERNSYYAESQGFDTFSYMFRPVRHCDDADDGGGTEHSYLADSVQDGYKFRTKRQKRNRPASF